MTLSRIARLCLLVLIVAASAPAGSARAQTPAWSGRVTVTGGAVAYAAATGHHVAGAFLLVWRARGGLTTLGYPLSEATMDPHGRWSQVFERGLLTLPPSGSVSDLASAPQVAFAALGRELTADRKDQPAFAPRPAAPDSLYFPETGHGLTGRFREHWISRHGLATLGLPLSEPLQEEGLTVQWFERGRLELAPGSDVVHRTAVGRRASSAAALITPPAPPAAGAVALESLPPLPAPERLAPWAADGFGLGPQALSVLAPVGKGMSLPLRYAPPDLAFSADSGLPGRNVSARALLMADLAALIDAGQARGLRLTPISAYRSAEYQATVFNREVQRAVQRGQSPRQAAEEVSRSVARPGQSEHQLGTAIDFNSLSPDFGATPAGRFLAEEGWRYGFLISYPAGAEARTGYVYEPWHLRWVGRPLAAALWEHGYRAADSWPPDQPLLNEELQSALLLLPPS